ncbi:MAG: hypothetical protein M1814_001120 [Vezdaea aestivalis]|nr:MAG: hypothetical protein M1814_001120 [Vezdaea aestivalis]
MSDLTDGSSHKTLSSSPAASPTQSAQISFSTFKEEADEQVFTAHRDVTRTETKESKELGNLGCGGNSQSRELKPVSPPTSQKRPLPSPAGIDLHIDKSPSFRKSSRKRPRPDHTLGPSLAGPQHDSRNPPPLSPLFFSNHPQHRPPLPTRFSSSEAGVTMLNKAREEQQSPSSVTTLKLARGAMALNSASGAASSPSGRFSIDRSLGTHSLSPTGAETYTSTYTSAQLISQTSIVELLEQDERPTFIIDLATDANYLPGPLHIVYSNAALDCRGDLLDKVSGSSGKSSPSLVIPTPFLDFKAWATSFVKGREPLDITLPSFTYAEHVWTCSSLRKRLRVYRCESTPGYYQSFRTASSAPKSASSNGVDSNRTLRAPAPGKEGEKLDKALAERNDYFGPNALISPQLQIPASKDQVIQSIEHSPSTVIGAPSRDATCTPVVREVSDMALDRKGSEFGQIHDRIQPSIGTTSHFSLDPTLNPGFFDWTRLPDSPDLPTHIQFARSIDWGGSTSLGPMDNWSDDLRFMCNLLMASPHPAAMYWGDDLVSIYNEAYILIAGQKHPKLMGQPYKEAWKELWDDIKHVFANAMQTGQSIMKDDDRLFMLRNGYLEESYFSWALIPLITNDGSITGFYNPAFEKTRRNLAERRMLTLREVGEKTATARDVKAFWKKVIQGLEYNEEDAPFVLVYSVADDNESDNSSVHSNSYTTGRHCILEGSLGIPDGHHAAPQSMDLKSSETGFCKYFRESIYTDRPVVLDTESGNLDGSLIEGFDPRGFGDPARSVVVFPIHAATGESVLGFLVIGVNPRRPFDDDYNLFVDLLSRQLATSLSSVVLFEAEIRRGRRAAQLAAQDKFELSEQLRAKAQEAVESEMKFSRMAEFAPVGMFIANSMGLITFCNDTFYEISRHPRKADGAEDWKDSVRDEDRAILEDMWTKVVDQHEVATAEFRFKSPYMTGEGEKGETWVLASAFPEKNPDGSLKSVFGSITNISQQKWAEDLQRKRREEAVELKRQQENFIDITSHEMRNPLSAILQCADEIASSLAEYDLSSPGQMEDIISGNIDAAQTIALCAQHQKRIVDDVLTMSKLDSDLLLVTPVDVQPLDTVQKALKMFEGEVEKNDIAMQLEIDSAYKRLGIDWVRLDPSRLLQVLINLTTNAIKFTQTQEKRTIILRVGASVERPINGENSVSYVPARIVDRDDPTQRPEWGSGEQIFLHFAVMDTGRGLKEDEVKLLFQRFSQASPRTHVQYGGSGLGLFISRGLTEKQGGEIGVSSQAGVGSTFAFYIKARRSVAPAEALELPRRKLSTRGVKGSLASRTSSIDKGQKANVVLQRSAAKLSLANFKLLMVEDNLVNQRVLKRQLVNLKCDVQVANHGAEGLEYLRKTSFWRQPHEGVADLPLELHVVLMDLEMPVMDGLTATRKIRELEENGDIVRHVPIIAVTANARPEQIATAFDAGMDDVISKPFGISELVPKIEELAERFDSFGTTT